MAGYTRQDTANNIANGNVIDADDFDAEYNQIESAFNASSGHVHDGTSGNGAPIEKVGPSQDLVITATKVEPKTTNTLDLGSSAVQFKDGFFDGTVDTDTMIVSANGTVGGTLGVTGVLTASGGVVGDVTGTVSDVSNHDTDDIAEGSNRYFTTQRSRDSVSATGSLSYSSSTGVFSFTQGDTDTVSEGTSNLYYTTARATTDAKAAISVTDSGGDGSLTYSAGTITYTGPSATETRAHLSAGEGIDFSAGVISGENASTSNKGVASFSSTDFNVSSGAVSLKDSAIKDIVGTMVSGNTESGISVVYQTGDDTLDFNVNDPTITLSGAVTGSGTMTNLGNVSIATTATADPTLTLSGDASGSATFTNLGNATLNVTVANNSHSHTIGNITGLQTEIDTKAEKAGSSSQAFSASTVNATTVDLGAWTVTQSGTDLKFAYNGTNLMKLDSSGNLTVEGNVTAYGDA